MPQPSTPPEAAPSADAEIARRMAAGDRAALEEAYRRHRDRVFSTAYRLMADAGSAADLTHDAFVRAFERAAQYRGEAALGTWISRIALNLGLRQLRRERWLLRFAAERAWRAVPAEPAPAAAIDLDRALLRLPAALRTALVLVTLEGYPHAEAAAALGISEAACRQRVHRARAALAAELRPEEEE
ncbi:MAG TPA: RNA polymerase sigma factor [Longimicrobium sp.]|nr:RNA polymerase sigma factor [Longimicrobium sp.]